MDQQKEIQKLKTEGYDNVWVYEAEGGEVDEEHDHDYDTKLVILTGAINIISEMDGLITNTQYKAGSEVIIPRNKLHSAKVAVEGCLYIVAERH